MMACLGHIVISRRVGCKARREDSREQQRLFCQLSVSASSSLPSFLVCKNGNNDGVVLKS